MKTLLMTVFLLFSTFIYSQQEKDSTNNYKLTEAERIIDKYGGQIREDFNNLIDTATPIAEEGFEVVVRLQIAKGIISLIPIFIFIITAYLFNKEYVRIRNILNSDDVPSYMNERYSAFSSDNISVLGVLYFIVMISSFVLGIACIYTAISHLIAPEWYAIKEILNLL